MRDYYTLEVGELIDELTEIIPLGVKMKYLEKEVRYDFNPIAFITKLKSWRGVYSELTLDYDINKNKSSVTLGDLIKDLKNSIKGKVFRGYKGGEFRMNIDTPVWADPYGMYNERAIIGVEDTEDFILIKTMIKK